MRKVCSHKKKNIIEYMQISPPDRPTETSGWIFIDLKKVFDTVDHAILRDKPNHIGFRGIINKWFSFYFQDRTQTAQVGPHVSERTLTDLWCFTRFSIRPITDFIVY